MGYASIRQAIVTQLEAINELHMVYDHEAPELAKYPAATVEPQNNVNGFATLAQNKRSYFFAIRCYAKIDPSDPGDADTLLVGIADTVIQAFEQNIRLNGVCERCRPLNGKWDRPQRETPVRMFEITLEVIENAQVR